MEHQIKALGIHALRGQKVQRLAGGSSQGLENLAAKHRENQQTAGVCPESGAGRLFLHISQNESRVMKDEMILKP